MNGTNDEALPPATVDANRSVMERYAKKYRVGRVEGLHHYLFTQDSIKVVGTLWMRYIESGFFDRERGSITALNSVRLRSKSL